MNRIEVLNLVPKFVSFYEKAEGADGKMDSIFELWEEHYNFAAVPPGDEGREMARTMVETAWSKYEDVIPTLQSWKPNEKRIEELLRAVKELLGYEDDLSMTVVYFVGAFDENPFVAPTADGGLALCLPVESGASDIFLAHELTHIVHANTANLSITWERSIGATVLQEGLAMRVSQAVVPGLPDENYAEHKEGWLAAASSKKIEILQGIITHLEDSSSEAVMKFTFGDGTAGVEREAYYTGWVLVETLLKNGVSFKEIASLTEEEMPEFVRKNIEEIITASSQ